MTDNGYVVNVDCAVARGDEYLLVERAASEDHAAGELGLPGGKLEADPGTLDAIEGTAVREVREEVGVAVTDVAYVCSSTFAADFGAPCLQVVTMGTYDGGEAFPREPDEVAAVHWLSREDLDAREDVPPYIERYVDQVAAARGDASER